MTKMMMTSASRATLVLAAGAALLTAANAGAQVAAAPVADEPGTSNDIVITARKTDERLQDVPVSVTAITGDALRDRGAVEIKDVLRTVPGLSNSGFDRGLSRYNIRGLSSGAASPTTGIYLDDISLVTIATTFSGGLDPVFFDMARVEVLKGPQGTLYGGSAMGGAIKYVSNTPDVNNFGVNTAAGVAFTDAGAPSYNGEVVVNAPFAPGTFAMRAGFFYRHDGGYIDNVPGNVQVSTASSTPFPVYTPLQLPALSTRNERDANYGDTWVGRLSFEWQPDATWSIRPQLFYQLYEQANASLFFLGRPKLESSFRIEQPNHDRSGIYSLNVDKDLGFAKATSLTAYFDRQFDYVRDYSFFVGNLLAPLYPLTSSNLSNSEVTTFSQELRLASKPGGALQWLIGAYYNNQNDRLFQAVDTPGVAALFGTDRLYLGDTRTNTKQYALFGEATLTLFDRLDLTAGLRAFRIDQRIDGLNDGPLNGGLTTIAGRKSREDGLNPKVGVAYRATENNLLYASAAKGFRPGGPNRYRINPTLCGADLAAIGLTEAPEVFGSDNLWTYEAGTKNNLAGGRITLNAAAFLTKWKKIQSNIGLPSCGFGFTTNLGEAEIKGFEVEARVEPVRGFELGGNAAYTDGEITKAAPGTSAAVGQSIAEIPDWTATAYAGYTIDVADRWWLSLRGEYQYQGRAAYSFDEVLPVTYADGTIGAVPNAFQFRESYDVVNAFVTLTHSDTRVRLYANNLTNARPLLDPDPITGADRGFTLRPRTIGLEVRQGF